MPQCSYPSQVAYTSWQRYHNDVKVTSRDDILCECPDGHNYLDTKYDFTMEGEDSIVKIDYFCLPVSVAVLSSNNVLNVLSSCCPVTPPSTARTSQPSRESTSSTPSVCVRSGCLVSKLDIKKMCLIAHCRV